VDEVTGYPAYYSELLDDEEMTDLSPVPVAKLVYGGSWAHANGEGMYDYQRSLSTSQGSGATLKYTFTGTGLDVLGPNNGSAKLEVTVDGQVVNASAATMASNELYQAFTLRGLTAGTHTKGHTPYRTLWDCNPSLQNHYVGQPCKLKTRVVSKWWLNTSGVFSRFRN
jgi:hypothetical protein